MAQGTHVYNSRSEHYMSRALTRRGPGKTHRYRATQPPAEAWIAAAHAAARETLTEPSDVLGGSTKPRCALARRLAWKAVLADFSDCSVAGLARVSGFDHTAILYSLGRLKRNRTIPKTPTLSPRLSVETALARLPQPINYPVPVYESIDAALAALSPEAVARWKAMRGTKSFISPAHG